MLKPFPDFDFPPFGAPDQIAYLVPDLVTAADQWTGLFGSGEGWRFYTYSSELLRENIYRSAQTSCTFRIANTTGVEPEVELIQPLSGPSIYQEWIDKHGYGLHHIAYNTDSLERSTAWMAARGYEPIQSGLGFGVEGDGGYVYFDTEEDFGVLIEFIEPARIDHDSEDPRPTQRFR